MTVFHLERLKKCSKPWHTVTLTIKLNDSIALHCVTLVCYCMSNIDEKPWSASQLLMTVDKHASRCDECKWGKKKISRCLYSLSFKIFQRGSELYHWYSLYHVNSWDDLTSCLNLYSIVLLKRSILLLSSSIHIRKSLY